MPFDLVSSDASPQSGSQSTSSGFVRAMKAAGGTIISRLRSVGAAKILPVMMMAGAALCVTRTLSAGPVVFTTNQMNCDLSVDGQYVGAIKDGAAVKADLLRGDHVVKCTGPAVSFASGPPVPYGFSEIVRIADDDQVIVNLGVGKVSGSDIVRLTGLTQLNANAQNTTLVDNACQVVSEKPWSHSGTITVELQTKRTCAESWTMRGAITKDSRVAKHVRATVNGRQLWVRVDTKTDPGSDAGSSPHDVGYDHGPESNGIYIKLHNGATIKLDY